MNKLVKNWVNDYMTAEQSNDYIGCALLLDKARHWASLRNLLLICAYLDGARAVETVEDCKELIGELWKENASKHSIMRGNQ